MSSLIPCHNADVEINAEYDVLGNESDEIDDNKSMNLNDFLKHIKDKHFEKNNETNLYYCPKNCGK